jgi:hypothetical protein
MTRRRTRPEDQIQRAVFDHLRVRGAPHVFAFHPANGGYRKPIEAAVLNGLGVRAGVPDVIAIHEGRCYGLDRALAVLEVWGLLRGQASITTDKSISR